MVLAAARKRDKEVCALCGWDYRKAYREWEAMETVSGLTWLAWQDRMPRPVEYDHIVPFSEGGLTVLENIRTLCHDCHVRVTSDWRWRKANERKKQLVLI